MSKGREIRLAPSNGALEVRRGVAWVTQMCPWALDAGGKRSVCGTWCPHFDTMESDDSQVTLKLCCGTTITVMEPPKEIVNG